MVCRWDFRKRPLHKRAMKTARPFVVGLGMVAAGHYALSPWLHGNTPDAPPIIVGFRNGLDDLGGLDRGRLHHTRCDHRRRISRAGRRYEVLRHADHYGGLRWCRIPRLHGAYVASQHRLIRADAHPGRAAGLAPHFLMRPPYSGVFFLPLATFLLFDLYGLGYLAAHNSRYWAFPKRHIARPHNSDFDNQKHSPPRSYIVQ